MATSNRIRALNRLPFDFEDGLKVGGVDVTSLNQAFTPAGAGLIGFTPVGNLSAVNVQAALAELDNEKAAKVDLAATGGSSLVGYDGGTVQDVMDSAKPIADYVALRAYTGRATSVRITSNGLSGFFYRDDADITSADNGGTIIVSSIGKRWKRLFAGAVNIRWFGAKGDGVTNDTAAVINVITYACANNKIIDGENLVYAFSDYFQLTNEGCKLFGISNTTLKSLGENANEGRISITVANATVDLTNFKYDGNVDNKYSVTKMRWYGLNFSSTGADFGVSVWPISSTNDFAFKVVSTYVNCNNIALVNSHSCGFSFTADRVLKIDGFIALNTTFTSLYSSAGATQITNYYAVNCGRPLPASFDVYNNNTATWSYGVGQADGFYAQGSFGLRLGGEGSISLTNAYVKNYYTAAIVLDTRSKSNISNIYIENDQNVTITNQVSGAIFYELSTGSSASNIHINMKKRNETIGNNLFSIYLYTEFGSCNFENVILQDSLSASLTNYTFFIVDNEGSQINLSNISIQNARTTGKSRLHGRLNYPSRQPGKVNITSVSVIGNAWIDFRDFRHVSISNVGKDINSVVDVDIGQFQAAFPNTAYISDSDLSTINGVSAGSGVNIDNCRIVGEINVYGETSTNSQSSITNCNITLTDSGQFSGSGSNSTLRIADNVFTTNAYTLGFRNAGVLEFTNNILRYNGSVNGVNNADVGIVKNIGTTALRGPAATASVGYSLIGSVATYSANNDTIAFDFT